MKTHKLMCVYIIRRRKKRTARKCEKTEAGNQGGKLNIKHVNK